MDPLEGTSSETRTTTTSEEGAEKTAQAAALKGLLNYKRVDPGGTEGEPDYFVNPAQVRYR